MALSLVVNNLRQGNLWISSINGFALAGDATLVPISNVLEGRKHTSVRIGIRKE